MTVEEFGSFAAGRGWKCAGPNAYGVYRTYPFSLFLKSGRVTSLTAEFRLGKGLPTKVQRAINKELPKGCSLMQPQAGTLNLITAGTEETLEQNLRTGMDAVTTALRDAGVSPPEACPYCRQKGCDSLAAIGGSYLPTHRACVTEHSTDTVAQAEKNLVVGSYGLGILGAFLGGLVASIPSILTVVFLESTWAILYLLLPMGAWYGYRKLGGKQTKGAFWIIAAMSLLHTLITVEVGSGYVFYVQATGQWPNLLAFIPYFYQLMGADIIVELIFPVFWLVLGLFTTRGKIGRTAHHEIRDAGTAMETLMSYTASSMPDL